MTVKESGASSVVSVYLKKEVRDGPGAGMLPARFRQGGMSISGRRKRGVFPPGPFLAESTVLDSAFKNLLLKER